MYLIVPFALDLIITFILSKMNVEKANAEIKEDNCCSKSTTNFYTK